MTPYREPNAPDLELPDPEMAAITVLVRRAKRVRTIIQVPILLAGLIGGAVLYGVLRDLQFASRGVHFPWLTGTVSFLPTFVLGFRLAPRIADLVVGRFLPGWRKELAAQHGLDLAELEEMTRLLE